MEFKFITLALLFVGLYGMRLPCRADLWTTGYYAGWMQDTLPASEIDFSAVTHLIHFSLIPRTDGTLDADSNSLTPSRSSAVVTRAHAAGRKILICVGGAGTADGFRASATPARRAAFVQSLVNFMQSRHYDGIDVDWEPLETQDAKQYTDLIHALRTSLNSLTGPTLLTAATATEPALFASLHAEFDQINLMTYDLSGPWEGWVTWFNAPIFDGGYRFASTDGLVPSADGMTRDFIASGIPPKKLAIGIAFYGIVWSGGTGTSSGGASRPRQEWNAPPTTTGRTYSEIMSDYYQASRYHWDNEAQSAYLTIDGGGSANDKFISYDDEHTCQAKVSYARNLGLGGVMIWELGSGYRPTQPKDRRDPLVSTIKQSLATPRFTKIQAMSQGVELGFTSLPLAKYRILWTADLNNGIWKTLSPNIAGTGNEVRIMDPSPPGSSSRFYRIQTPP